MANQSEDLRRIHDFTANYFFWQGLRWVPLGIGFLILAAEPGRWLPFGRKGSTLLVTVTITFVAIAASNAIGAWYARTYGRVRGTPGRFARRDHLKWTVFYPMIGIAMCVDGIVRPPLLVSALAWAIALVAYWSSTGRGRNHYLAIAAGFFVATFLPLTGGNLTAVQRLDFLLALMGMAYVIGGILDHRALVRMMNSIGGDDDRAV